MGLDMCLYRAAKSTIPPSVLKNRTFEEVIRSFPTICLFYEENEFNKSLKSYFQYADLKCDIIELKQLAIDNNIPTDAIISGKSMSHDKTTYCFSWIDANNNNQNKNVTVIHANSPYIKTVTEQFPYCDLEQLMYWRKADDICNFIHDNHPNNIENCEYVRLSPKLVKKVIDKTYQTYGQGVTDVFDNDYAKLANIKNYSNIFYKEWY